MSGGTTKKDVSKYCRHIVHEFLTAPLKNRLKIAFLIIKGKKRLK